MSLCSALRVRRRRFNPRPREGATKSAMAMLAFKAFQSAPP